MMDGSTREWNSTIRLIKRVTVCGRVSRLKRSCWFPLLKIIAKVDVDHVRAVWSEVTLSLHVPREGMDLFVTYLRDETVGGDDANVCVKRIKFEIRPFGCYFMPMSKSLLLLFSPLFATTARVTVSNKLPRVDTDGRIVDAHSGNIVEVNGTYFMWVPFVHLPSPKHPDTALRRHRRYHQAAKCTLVSAGFAVTCNRCTAVEPTHFTFLNCTILSPSQQVRRTLRSNDALHDPKPSAPATACSVHQPRYGGR